MSLISAKSGIASPFCVYTIEANSEGPANKAKRFLGCSFPCSENGILVTCNHVIHDITSDEILMVQHLTETINYKAQIIGMHPKYDIAFLKTEAKISFCPSPILDRLSLASKIWAYGYYDTFNENGKIIIIPQVYSGTITATPTYNLGILTGLPFYQISFPALPGFSGSPLYFDSGNGAYLCGMLFENRSSKVVVRTLDEYKDDKMHFIENSVREWESGIAHTTMCLKQAAVDLKIKIWKKSNLLNKP